MLVVESDEDSAAELEVGLAGLDQAPTGIDRVRSLAPSGWSEKPYGLVVLNVDDEASALEHMELRRAEAATSAVVAVLPHRLTGLQVLLRREGADEVCVRSEDGRLPIAEFRHLCRFAVERRHMRKELERARTLGMHLAHHDTLTDLPNRQLFLSRLRHLIGQSKRRMRSLAVFFIDLDRFKQINDTLGHPIGDMLLLGVSERLAKCLRDSDTVARRGGDEFTIILDGIARGQDAGRVARKILDALARPFFLDGHELFVSASIGISLYPADGADVDTLVKHADIAMYRAKARGGNNYQFFLPEMTDRALERLELESNLRQGIERNQLVLHYQPQLDIASGRVCGMEALVRWDHPDLGLIYPDEFIPLAEDTGLIGLLGDWVLQEACHQMKRWQEAGAPRICMAVNFSARQFQFQKPVERVERLLRDLDLEPELLDLELTESVVMKDATFAMEVLKQLRALGIQVSIDDFGMGYSSLAYLKRFPITRLKIDRSFIRNLLVDQKDAAITLAVIGMAHSLGIEAVAEGVETEEQLDFLRERKCDQMQGYLYSPPLPADRATELLLEKRPLVGTRA